MNKLLVISGPTAIGKTPLALELAKKFTGELVSADSRQVYKNLDIGTGKDITNFTFTTSDITWRHKQIGYYQKDNTKVWGLDLVGKNDDFSVAHFVEATNLIIQNIWSRGQLPIIAGGTGLYLKALINPPASISIKPDSKLRVELENLSVKQLQSRLTALNSSRFNTMNNSDRNNPRRLIRAIEIETHHQTSSHPPNKALSFDSLWIGLTAPQHIIDKKIHDRVLGRANHGMTAETQKLINSNFNWDSQAATATGYQYWKQYIDHTLTQQEAIKLWTTQETQYARRQQTWFKKAPIDHTFDTSIVGWNHQVALLVEDWYSRS